MIYISREAAKAAGLIKYRVDTPCKHGHFAERYTKTGACCQCHGADAVKQRAKPTRKQYDTEYYTRPESKQYNAKYRQQEDTKATYNERRIERTYGITIEQRNQMLVEQQHRCLICEQQLVSSGITGKSACIDHCHTTGKVRGILCSSCNMMLGLAKDDISVLEAAIKYLRISNQ